MRRCWFCVFETPSLITSLDMLTACICSSSPDEVFTFPIESAGLSLDSMHPSPVSPVSCNTFLSVVHASDFKDITDITYVRDELDIDACTVFDLQQKHAFGLLVSNVKESSVLPIIRKYSNPNATNYGVTQLLYDDLVSHFTKGLSGRQ